MRLKNLFLLLVLLPLTSSCISHALQLEPIKAVPKIEIIKPVVVEVDNAGFDIDYKEKDADLRNATLIPLWFYTTVKQSTPATQVADLLSDTLKSAVADSAQINSTLNNFTTKVPVRLKVDLMEGGLRYVHTNYGVSIYGPLVMYAFGFALPFDYGCRVELKIKARLISSYTGETVWGPKEYEIHSSKYTRPLWFNYMINNRLAEDLYPRVLLLSKQILQEINSELPPADDVAFYKRFSLPDSGSSYYSQRSTPSLQKSDTGQYSKTKGYGNSPAILHDSLVVKSLKARNVSKNTADALSDVIVNVLSGYSSVQSMDALAAINSLLEEKMKAGCDDTKCIIEVAGAMDISQVVTGSISKLDSRYMISLMLIQTKGDNLGVVKRAYEECTCSEGELIDMVRQATLKLVGM